MDELFIKYANADLENHPEVISLILESTRGYNRDIYQQNVSYPQTEIFKRVVNLCEGFGPHSESSYPIIFANSEFTKCCGEAFPFDRDIRLIALDGAFFWAAREDGCKGCKYKEGGTRDQFNGKKLNCLHCDQTMVCDILERIINGADLETMEGYQILEGAENEIIKKSKIPCKKGSEEKTLIDRFIDGDDLETVEPEEVFKDTTWVDPTILRSEYGIEKQQFSTFVLGCVGHSLLHFLHKERKEKKTNRNRLQRCWNCKTFFIKKRADAQGTCEACKKNGVQKPRDAIYFREYRKAVKQKKENNEIRAYKEAKDCTWAEARDAHKK